MGAQGQRLKILISAYACDPRGGSEQGFAWWWVNRCAQTHDVTVITCAAQKEAIENASSNGDSSSNIRFEYVQGPGCVSPSGVELPFEPLRAYLWQLRAIGRARRLTRGARFDIAQHITIATWRLPSCLAFTDVPLVLGPISGAEVLPPGFAWKLGLAAWVPSVLRAALLKLAWHDPLVRLTLRRSRKILVSGPETFRFMKRKYPGKVSFYSRAYPALSVPQATASSKQPSVVEEGVRLVWMARLVPRKGLDLLLRALADPRLRRCRLDVLGDGPRRRYFERLAAKRGLDGRVRFAGHVRRSEALRRLANYDVFVFTSLRDMMGQSLSEAMQAGLPCVVMDWGGPGALAGRDGAAKVGVAEFEQSWRDLADTLARICGDRRLRTELSQRGRRRILDLISAERLARERDRIFNGALEPSVAHLERAARQAGDVPSRRVNWASKFRARNSGRL